MVCTGFRKLSVGSVSFLVGEYYDYIFRFAFLLTMIVSCSLSKHNQNGTSPPQAF